MGTSERGRPSGLVIGGLIGTFFGLGFVEANSGGFSGGWVPAARIAGGVVAVVLVATLIRAWRRGTGRESDTTSSFSPRKYRIIVVAEMAAMVAGLVVLNAVLDRPQLSVAWVALVVGAHFYAFGVSFGLKRFHLLATAMTVLGLAGFALYFAGASNATIAVVSGVCSGVALYASVGDSLVRQPT